MLALVQIKTQNISTLPLFCGKHITLSKIDKICSLAISNWNFTISMHIYSKFGENPLTFTQAIAQKHKYDWADIPQSKINEICPLAIPYQITISMYISNLIFACYLPETKIQMDI